MQADKLMKWRSRGPREDWPADENTSNGGFNPRATSPPCLPIHITPSLRFCSVIFCLSPSLALHTAQDVNRMSNCVGKLQYVPAVSSCTSAPHVFCTKLCDTKERERVFFFFFCLLLPSIMVPTEDLTDLTH